MRIDRDKTARALSIGTFGFIVERVADGGLMFGVTWQDATNGVTLRTGWEGLDETVVFLPRRPLWMRNHATSSIP